MFGTKELIHQYQLQPHPEGGWYKENYKSKETISAASLPEGFGGPRAFSTAIYFLLEQGNFSAFHRIKSDECWHFYAGDPLDIYVLRQNGKLDVIHLGSDISQGHLFQYVVPANCWFASRPATGSRFCFTGCTVAPGFDFADFELADIKALTIEYPHYESVFKSICR